MKTAHRISAFASRLDELQACLARASNRATENVTEAQRIAAELALFLEDGISTRCAYLRRSVRPTEHRIHIIQHIDSAALVKKSTPVDFFVSVKRIEPDKFNPSPTHN